MKTDPIDQAPWTVNTLTVPAGQKVRGVLPIPGTGLELPLTLIHGANPGPLVLVSAGVHGGEYGGIEAAMRFAREVDPQDVSGRLAFVHIYGISAFHARQQYLVPEDGKNPNRVFPGRATGTVSERMAATLMETFVVGASAWVDLHGGDIHEALEPFVIYTEAAAPEVVAKSRAMAEAFGLPYVVTSQARAGNTYAGAASVGVPGILAEAGGMGQLEESSVALLLRGLANVSHLLGILPGSPELAPRPTVFSRFDWLRSEHRGCWYPAVGAGDKVREGQLIGVIKDYWGDTLTEHRVSADGVVLFVVTSLAINPTDPLVGVGVV